MTAPVDYPFGTDAPAPTEPLAVADGVYWLRFPLPFKLDHINLWLFEDDGGWALVDTGMANEQTQALWSDLLDTALLGRPLNRIIVTHFHPDHMGNAGWLSRRLDIPVYCAQGEWAMAKLLFREDDDTLRDVARAFYHMAGVGDDFLDDIAEQPNRYRPRISPPPNTFRRLRHDDRITIGNRDWRIVVAHGHAPEHVCLFREDDAVLISGDQVLPRITPNISVWPHEPEADPLALFIESIARFRPLPPETTVLPSHDWPFRGLHGRLDTLEHHHDDRLAAVRDACRTSCSALGVLRVLFNRKLDQHQMFFAIGESLAHLHYLEGEGVLRRETDGTGVTRFVQA